DPGNGTAVFSGVSRDGRAVAFATDQSLTPDDHDGGEFDIYKRENDGTTYLASGATRLTEPAGAPGGSDFVYISYDGKKICFTTFQKLDPLDTDVGKVDLSCNTPEGGTSLESKADPGTPDDNVEDVTKVIMSADGNHEYFETKGKFSGDDNDSHWRDVYER